MFWKTGCNCLPGYMEKAARKHREGFELRQPKNYIEAVDSDSIEMKTAELLSGKRLSSLPIQDITGEHIDTDNEYMYYYSVEFIK